MYELSPEVIAREVAENRANEHLLHLIPKDVLSKALSQYYCEIESDFLCFALPYEAVAECIPATIPVIDLGCYMAAQAYFFRNHPAYVGVDCYEMCEDFSSLRRFSLPNCRHVSAQIQDCAEALKEEYPDAYAVCIAVPDNEARLAVSHLFPNHCICYPGEKPDVSGLNASRILKRLRF